MASHFDLAARLERLGVAEEFYSGEPPALLAKVAALVRSGRYPVAVNTKGSKPDDVLIVVSLSAYEHMMPVTGFEQADGD